MRRSALLTFLILPFLVTSLLAQQPKLPQLTWVRYLTVQPAQQSGFVQLMRDSYGSTFEKLIADKKIQAWGMAVPITHTNEPWTHVVYITVDDWAAVENLINAVEAADMARSAADNQRLDALWDAALAPGSTRDVILRHLVQSEMPPKARPKYIDVSTYTVKPGRAADALALYKEWAVPLFMAGAERGNVGPWGFSVQAMPTTGDWTHLAWTFLSDATALGQLEDASMSLPPMKLAGYDVRLRDLSEPEKHREQLLRIVYQSP